MKRLLKIIEYKGVAYEIMMVQRLSDRTWFLKDFKNNIPFSPYYYGIDGKLDGWDKHKIEEILNEPIVDYLIYEVESGIKFWVENKDKLKLLK